MKYEIESNNGKKFRATNRKDALAIARMLIGGRAYRGCQYVTDRGGETLDICEAQDFWASSASAKAEQTVSAPVVMTWVAGGAR
jgi:hypothetical protein